MALTSRLHAQVSRTVDFDGLAFGTPLDGAYSSLGLSIPGARVDTTPRPRSGRQVGVVRLDQAAAVQPLRLTLVFATAQESVTFFAGTNASPRASVQGSARALDALGAVVAQAQDSVSKGSCSTQFTLRTTGPTMRQVQLDIIIYNPFAMAVVAKPSVDLAIDDLVFEGLPLPPRVVHVPRLIGLTDHQARIRLSDSGLIVGKKGQEVAKGIVGTIYRQDPNAGAPARAGDRVNIVLIARPPATKLVRVPKLVGHTLQGADSLLRPLSLHLGAVLRSEAPGGLGTISRQKPEFGSVAQSGDSVEVELVEAPPPQQSPSWWLVAVVTVTILAATTASLRDRWKPHRPKLKAVIVPASLSWRDESVPVHAPLHCEVRFRVSIGVRDDGPATR